MSEPEIFPLTAQDASALAALLGRQRKEYVTSFHPFAFDAVTIGRILADCRADRFWGLRMDGELAGFFMLRGFDEGYARPSFGVLVSEESAGRGLARLAIGHALQWCAENGVECVMLKVDPANGRALRIYQDAGFEFAGRCPRTGQDIMEKHMTACKNR
jgi:RimJ/RimL family protein N-acetyltransferase